ncbi:putative serine/threonine-protein kinase WNK4 isoform X2 [Carex rostrata]
MLQSPENLSRLYSEVHFLKTLKHENILKYYSSWVDDEKRTVNIITELFTSGSLREYRKKHDCVDLKAIKNWARQILRGLEYLHGHQPPIIHRDLKCDNIFVNGNNGQVKIGDLGLATMMLQDKAQSVLGTPEFMAPELYEEEYNELVDIYSFGMCMLEMVTLDYPYSECRNAAQIYKRVTSGVKPAALEKVTNLQVRQFIDKCLVPASERKSAKELLKDPFLHCNYSHEMKHNKVPPSYPPPKLQSSASVEEILLDIEAECQSDSVCENIEGDDVEVEFPSLELVRTNGDNEFWLRGERQDENTVFFYMHITNRIVPGKNVNFVFYLDSDTSLRVAEEMVEQLDLPDHDVPFISEFIDYLIMCLVPGWRPHNEEFSSLDYTSTAENSSCNLETEFAMENELMLENRERMINNLSLENGSDQVPNRLSSNSTLVHVEEAESIFGLALAQLLGISEERKPDSDGSSASMRLLGTSKEVKANFDDLSTSTTPEGIMGFATDGDCTVAQCKHGNSESSTIRNGQYHAVEAIGKKVLNGSTLQCLDKDKEDGLQSEIDDIREHYRHLFEELTRMREVAFENVRKRWMRKMGKRPA